MSIEKNMVKDAREIIKGIKQFQNTAGDKFANIDRQIEDLTLAQRKLCEAQSMPKPVEMSGGDYRLKSFVKKDGSIQLGTEKQKIQTNNTTIETDVDGLLTTKTPANEWHKELIDLAKKKAWCKTLMSSPHTPKTDLEIYRHIQKAPSVIKDAVYRSFYDAPGSGGDFVPDILSDQLVESFMVPRNLRALLPTIEVRNGGSLLLPRMSRGGVPFKKGVVDSDNAANYRASTILTEQISITVQGMASRYVIDDSMYEDSALAISEILGRSIASDLEDAFEDAILNSDTAASHQDAIGSWSPRNRWPTGALGGADDHRRLFQGFRARAFDNGTAAAGTPAGATTTELLGRIAAMGEFGVGNLIIVASPEAMIKHLMSNSDLLTIQNFGERASLVNGQIGSIFGHAVMMSRFLTADMDAAGVYAGGGNSQTGIVFFNAASFAQYQKRGVTIEQQKDIKSGSVDLVATMRSSMHTVDGSSQDNCSYLYNLNS